MKEFINSAENTEENRGKGRFKSKQQKELERRQRIDSVVPHLQYHTIKKGRTEKTIKTIRGVKVDHLKFPSRKVG